MTDGIDVRLAQPLSKSAVKQREAGAGKKLSYIETHHAIRTANEIFGFGGWGHEVVALRQIGSTLVHNKSGNEGTHVGYLCVVRLSVNGRLSTSGVGYGDAVEYRESAPVTAHELAAKEAESDALKRALKNYGDQFGLALYDKDAAKAGHLTDSEQADLVRSDGKVAAKPAPNFATWVKRMTALEVRHPEEWARLYTEASGTDRKLVLQRLNTVLLDLADGEPPYEAFMEGWRERLQGSFSRAFGGVVVDGPADDPVSATPPAARPRDEDQAKWEEETPF